MWRWGKLDRERGEKAAGQWVLKWHSARRVSQPTNGLTPALGLIVHLAVACLSSGGISASAHLRPYLQDRTLTRYRRYRGRFRDFHDILPYKNFKTTTSDIDELLCLAHRFVDRSTRLPLTYQKLITTFVNWITDCGPITSSHLSTHSQGWTLCHRFDLHQRFLYAIDHKIVFASDDETKIRSPPQCCYFKLKLAICPI
jgi:hypothetical protein